MSAEGLGWLAAPREMDLYLLCKANSAAPGDKLSEGLLGVSGAAGPLLGSQEGAFASCRAQQVAICRTGRRRERVQPPGPSLAVGAVPISRPRKTDRAAGISLHTRGVRFRLPVA